MSIKATGTPQQTNCRNCGAPLHGQVCEYCGTVYGEERQLFMKINTEKYTQEDIAQIVKRIKHAQTDNIILLDSGIEFVHLPTMTRR